MSWVRLTLNNKSGEKFQIHRYRCTYIQLSTLLYWKTSVSDHCCLACTNTAYKADTVIETIEFDDDCKSIETQVCRKLPGINLCQMWPHLILKSICIGHEQAKIESEFNYKACCNDNTGLQVLGSEVYQSSTCSQRTCFYDKYLPFSLWISKQVRKYLLFKNLNVDNRVFA